MGNTQDVPAFDLQYSLVSLAGKLRNADPRFGIRMEDNESSITFNGERFGYTLEFYQYIASIQGVPLAVQSILAHSIIPLQLYSAPGFKAGIKHLKCIRVHENDQNRWNTLLDNLISGNS